MCRSRVTLSVFVFVFSFACFAANLTVTPTTTLTALTSNNTSAADAFITQSNGNLGATNISKVDIHTLLYPGATTRVYAHLVLWFGGSNHMNVGYSSTDPARVKRQIEDMISRGIDGVIIDWYGPNNAVDQATQLVMSEAEAHPGFTFAIMVDKGAIRWNSCSGCTPQQALIQQLQYVEQKYFSSPSYLKQEGRPVVTNFDIDLSYTIDWKTVQAALGTNPVFLFQNRGGFIHVLSEGSYSWVIPTTSDYGMNYLTDFYSTGMTFPGKLTVGASYKGFNDSLAAWGANRSMSQRCGQTWLQTFAKINSLYNSSNQLHSLQLVTWNDYEEGTEIESGIDNCVAVRAAVSGDALQWNLSGDESTIDHYTIYVSNDGQNLMPLTDVAAGVRSMNMCSYPLSPGSYTLYVQAVGKPSLTNNVSAAVPYLAQCGEEAGEAITLATAPPSMTMVRGQSASTLVTVTSLSGSFNKQVSLSCSNLPAGLTCSFSPAAVIPGTGGASSTLTILPTPVSLSWSNGHEGKGSTPPGLVYLFTFGVAGLVNAGRIGRKRFFQLLLAGAVAGIIITLSSCGGSQAAERTRTSMGAPRGTYTIVINGNSGTIQASTSATVTIN